MLSLIARRLLTALPTLLVVIVASFVLMRLAPGSPFDSERALDPATRAALDHSYGLDLPLPQQIMQYLWHILHGDFGPSMVNRDFSVSALVAKGLPVSMTLGGGALALALALGGGAGVLGTRYANGVIDHVVSTIATLLTVVPSFVSAPLLALIFGLRLGWLPVSGWGDAVHMVLPVVALALPVAGAITKLTRAGLRETMAGDNIRAARARGLKPIDVIMRHALRPALMPVASYLGPAAAGLLTGAVVIESVFGIPGLGRYFVQGALNRDYPLVMAVVILYAALIILFNLLADIAYGWLDPRVRG